jgi:hypothetical protein
MASVEIAIDQLEVGDVPAISVKTGKPCANPVGMRLRYVRAVLPVEPGRARLHRTFVWIGWPLFVLEVIGVFVYPLLTFLGLAFYVVLVLVDRVLWVGAKPGTKKGMLTLTRVHPAFADAVNR